MAKVVAAGGATPATLVANLNVIEAL